jgi:hypothetical protein
MDSLGLGFFLALLDNDRENLLEPGTNLSKASASFPGKMVSLKPELRRL